MKIAVIVLWGLTFAAFLMLFVCWAKVGFVVFRIHTYVRSHDHSIPLVFTPNTLKRIHEYFVCHKRCMDVDEESRRLRLVDPRTERRLLILWGCVHEHAGPVRGCCCDHGRTTAVCPRYVADFAVCRPICLGCSLSYE